MRTIAEIQDISSAVKAKLVDLGAERERVMNVIGSLQNLGNEVQRVESKITDLDEAERDEINAWVAGGAKGTAPNLDHAARELLQRELTEATAKSKAASSSLEALRVEVTKLNEEMRAQMRTLEALSLEAITTEAEARGNTYREALVKAEHAKAYLLALDRFLAAHQNAEDGRTTAFLPHVTPHIDQRDLDLQTVHRGAFEEAAQYWASRWHECIKVTST